MEQEAIPKEEWQRWKTNPVTLQFLADIMNMREGVKEALVQAAHSTEQARLVDIGKCQGIKGAMVYAIEDFKYMERQQEEDNSDIRS